MKYFRFIGDSSKDHLFENGKIYKGSFESLNWAKVKVLAEYNITDWEQVPKPKKTIHERIEKLKKQAESEGMKCEVVLSDTFTATNSKDKWEGVEFAQKNLTDEIRPIIGMDTSWIFTSHGIGMRICESNPSTEQAYIEQLKAKSFELFGEINEGETFIDVEKNHPLKIEHIFSGFVYSKKIDAFCIGGVLIYKQGQWAKRIKDKITVYDADLDRGLKNNFSFRVHSTEKVTKSKNEIIEFLSSKLEEYLNS
jgi:hypothetical protein